MIRRRLLRLLAGSGKYVAAQVVCQWLALLVKIGVSWCTVGIVTALLRAPGAEALSGELTGLGWRVGGIVGGALLGAILTRLAGAASFRSSAEVKSILRSRIYEKLLRLGASYRERAGSAAILQLMGEGVEQLEVYYGKYLAQLCYSLLAPLTLFLFLFPYSHMASLVLLACVPLIPLAIVAVQKLAKRLLRRYWGMYARLGDSFLDSIQGMTALKIYQADEERAGRLERESEHFRKVTMKVLTMQLNSTSVMDIVAYGGTAAGLYVMLNGYLGGEVTLFGALLFVLLSAEYFLPLRRLGSYFHIAMNGMAASDRIFALLDAPEPEHQGAAFPKKYERLVLEGVGYAYTEEREVLKNVSMTLPKGSFIALVGVSGSGKSTVAGLLTGRNRGYTGKIRIEGAAQAELSALDPAQLQSHITYVGTDAVIFKGTVRENLLLGKPAATEKELELALHVTGLDAELYLDTRLAEGGSDLSGGQRQRLALSRAILHNTPIYVFDEATSNIDIESEARMMALIHEIARKKTVFVISHRLSHAASSDRIYFLEDGQITEEGSFAELTEQDGAFARLYRQQRALEEYARTEESAYEEELQQAQGAYEEKLRQAQGDTAESEEERERSRLEADPNAAARAAGERRSGAAIMLRLLRLLKPLLPVMLLAVILGAAGALAAILIPGVAADALARLLPYTETAERLLLSGTRRTAAEQEALRRLLPPMLAGLLLGAAVLRGLLHYGEQYCNHYIAFRLLAIVRSRVFAALRRLCPAKLEGRDRGGLIALLTADIELLEVFYAHTISPIMIAVVVGIAVSVYLALLHPLAGVLAALSYLGIGLVLPLLHTRRGAADGMRYREALAELDSQVLEELKGIDEIRQYAQGERVLARLRERAASITALRERLARREGQQSAATELAIRVSSLLMLLLLGALWRSGQLDGGAALRALVVMMSSYGPVAALAALSDHLTQTLAAGERVLALLEEAPTVREVEGRQTIRFSYGVEAREIAFSYPGEVQVFDGFDAVLPRGGIIGLHGPSGSGKSTLLKLIMRFWDVDRGRISIAGADIRELNTADLRGMQAYMTQEAVIFQDTIAENIRIGRGDATQEEIEAAARKAALHDFILSLPEGYETRIGAEGYALSGGERQRLGIARAFLHNADILLMDEPTSNLDALNEGIILRSLKEECEGRTVVLVSHRKSTLRVADRVIEMGR